jgi:hypothetical protein
MVRGTGSACGFLVAGFLLGAFTVWALRDTAPAPQSPAAPDAARPAAAKTPAAPEAASRRPGRAAAPAPAAPSEAGSGPAGQSGATAGTASRDAPNAAAAKPKPTEPAAPPRTGRAAAPATPFSATAATKEPEIQSVVLSPAPTPPPLRAAAGVVVDAATQQPIGGARVLLAIAEGPLKGSWWGDTTGEDGTFHPAIHSESSLPASSFELRVSKDGYEPVRVPAAAEGMRVELRLRGVFPIPGRVVGVARTADGKPLAGEFEVDGSDEMGGNATQFAIADSGGAFALEGVPPGRWQLRVGRGPQVEAVVPEGGEVRIEFALGKPGDKGGLTVTDIDPSAVKPADPAAAERLAALTRLLAELSAERSPALEDDARARISRSVAQEIQKLDAASRAALPRREVQVTGLAAAAGGLRAWVRLEVRPRYFRRVEVTDGAARFPSVPVGTYTAVLVVPGRPDLTREVIVPPGDGAFATQWGR